MKQINDLKSIIRIILKIGGVISFAYGLGLSDYGIQTIYQQIVWQLERIMWILIALIFEVAQFNMKGGQNE